MAEIAMESAVAKAESFLASDKGQKKISDKVKVAVLGNVTIKFDSGATVHTLKETAEKFIDVLRAEINASGLSSNAISAIDEIEYAAPVRIGSSNQYMIRIYFAGDLSRPSLQESEYGRINDIAELLNYGVDHKMNPVYGTWHGKEMWSKTVIPGTHFMEHAVENFLSNYSSEYNVLDITIRNR